MSREQLVEKAATVLAEHRWKSMGVSSVQCECGEILYGDGSMTFFPADEAFRRHIAETVLDALEPRERIAELEAELDRTKRGAQTLGKIIDRQINDLLHWAGMDDQIGLDDPDQQTAWERVAAMPGRIRELEEVLAGADHTSAKYYRRMRDAERQLSPRRYIGSANDARSARPAWTMPSPTTTSRTASGAGSASAPSGSCDGSTAPPPTSPAVSASASWRRYEHRHGAEGAAPGPVPGVRAGRDQPDPAPDGSGDHRRLSLPGRSRLADQMGTGEDTV